MSNKTKKVTNNNKKLILIIVVLLLGVLLLVVNIHNRSSQKKIDLYVEYSNGTLVKYDDFSKKFTDTRTITIRNNTKDFKIYSLRWKNLNNTLKKQNLFLYEIKCEGDSCQTISPSQIPPSNANVIVFSDIFLEMKQEQKFTIKFIYKGSEKDAKFSGDLVIEEGVVNKELYKMYTTTHEKHLEYHQEVEDKVLNLK